MLLWGMGRYPEIVRTADATMDAARRSGEIGIEASALLGVGAGRAAYGLLELGIADLREAHALFLAAADPRTGIAMSQLCYALCLCGRHAEAVVLIDEELERQASIGTLRRFQPFLVTDLVDSYIELGRWDEAVALCEAELARAEESRAAPWYIESLGEIRALRGDVEGAAELLAAASDAVGLADAVIDRTWVLRTAIALGRIEGNIDRVRSAIDEALTTSADTSHDAPLWWLLCAAVAAEAEEADRAERSRDPNALATARERGGRLVRILEEAASALGSDEHRWPATLRAYVRHAAANRLSLEGHADAAAWAAATTAYDDIDYVYDVAMCRLRLAETILSSAGPREEAASPLRAAAGTAVRLRAEPLLAAVSVLAGRARIDLGTPADGGDDLGVGLTPREQEVLGLLAGGLTNREIGEALFISEKTASVHVSNILGKLGVGGRGAAVAMAMRLGFGMDAEAAGNEETANLSPAASARRDAPS
jgi:DNA-binding NarL/FixJ family response regulator